MEKSMDVEWISITAVKITLQSIKGGGMKKKRCLKIIIFVSAFCEKERKNWNKKCPVGVKGHGVSPFFLQEDHFNGRFFPAKETRTYSDEINVNMKQNILCGTWFDLIWFDLFNEDRPIAES